ncbi:MAG TPA: TonB-dependent siderophore receptor, partial [Erwinia persicina]|nr:TonB-dependent siderophore receptor [Erwinia persicina]
MLSLYLTAPASAAEGTADRKKSDSAAEPTTLTVTAAAPDRTEGPENGYVAEESGVGTKTRTPVLEIPQSVSVVTRRQMEIMQPSSSSAALRYTAGATSERYGGFGDYLDMTRIRGVDADYYLDGLRIISNPGSWLPQIDPWSLERIEVLRGPAAALYGQGTGGGIVNQVSLKPQDIASHHISLSYGSFHHQQFGVDSTGPVTDDNSLLYRFTASGLDTRGQIEDSRHRRLYLAPSVTWRPTDKATWTLMATYSWEPDIANYNSLPADLL